MQDAGSTAVTFPLTLAFSLRERENRCQSVGGLEAIEAATGCAWPFLLPEGEGKGEGERIVLRPLMVVICDNG